MSSGAGSAPGVAQCGNRHRPGRSRPGLLDACEGAAMDVEVHVDRTAYRRHGRGMFLGLLAFALYLPAVILFLTLVAAMLGREAAKQYTGEVSITGFVALMATTFYGTGIRSSTAARDAAGGCRR